MHKQVSCWHMEETRHLNMAAPPVSFHFEGECTRNRNFLDYCPPIKYEIRLYLQ